MRAAILSLTLTACAQSTAVVDTPAAEVDCGDTTEHIGLVVCAAEAFLATLTDAEKAQVQLEFSDSVAKTRWSNLPGKERSGIALGDLDEDSLAAAKQVARTVLSDAGYEDFIGVLAADDYLGNQGGGGGPGMSYGSQYYQIAFLGTPSTDGDWMLQIGGHHMAWNITWRAGTASPTPNHLGSEPKSSFTLNGESYAPVAGEGSALIALYSSFDEATLASAYLSGQMFADVVLGPVEYATGSYDDVVFPTGANRKGVKVSALTADQQALVTAVIAEWVADYDDAVAADLLAAYTSADAYADTLVAWGGTESKGVDVETSGTYMRIDGPRVWIEVAVQGGIVIRDETHYHTIYRDKTSDYGGAL